MVPNPSAQEAEEHPEVEGFGGGGSWVGRAVGPSSSGLGWVGPCWRRANSGCGRMTPSLPLLGSDVEAAVLFFQKLFR